MKVDVRLFSILRDCLPPAGRGSVELPERATLADLVSHLGIDRHLGCAAAELTTAASWQVMVSGQFELDMARVLRDGDEVHIFPPISGGH